MDQNKKTTLFFLLVILFSGIAIISGLAAFTLIGELFRSSAAGGSLRGISGGYFPGTNFPGKSYGDFLRIYYGTVMLVIILIILPIAVIITNIMGLSLYKKYDGIKRIIKYISVSFAVIMIIFTINLFGYWILSLNRIGNVWNRVLISLMLEIIFNQIVVIVASSKNKKLGTNTKNG